MISVSTLFSPFEISHGIGSARIVQNCKTNFLDINYAFTTLITSWVDQACSYFDLDEGLHTKVLEWNVSATKSMISGKNHCYRCQTLNVQNTRKIFHTNRWSWFLLWTQTDAFDCVQKYTWKISIIWYQTLSKHRLYPSKDFTITIILESKIHIHQKKK